MQYTRHISLLLSALIFGACSVVPEDKVDSDATSDSPIPVDPSCVPTITCNTEGARCGSIVDDCGNVLECGTCYLPYICGGSGTPNKCQNPCENSQCTQANKTICQVLESGVTCSCDPGYEDNGQGGCNKLEHVTIRLMTSNLTSGNGQSYKGPGIRILMGLKPDIVFMQEFNYYKSTDTDYGFENIDDFIDNVFGTEFSYHRGTGTIPNGIISRYPIKKSGQWIQESYQNRQYEWAVIDIPGDVDLWAISVHLLTDKSSRQQEAEDLAAYIKSNVPSGDYVAIGGDFNTSSRNENVYDALRDVVTVKGEYPDDQKGNENTNANRDKTYDGVYVSSALHNKETAVIVGSTNHESGLVFDSRKFSPLSAVSPVQYSDSAADNMQHMAVVRDFKLW